jgi:Flp pilus assembly protein TadD
MILPMWRLKMTARPGRARRYGGALGLLLLSSMATLPAQAMQGSPLDPATKAAMDKRAAARTLLSSALARIAANANDALALFDAGRASIDLDDHRAALGFLLRAEQAAPRDGAVKAALGSAMVHLENPARALDYFGEAQLLGVPERTMLADRALARDLLGQQDAAQRDYQLALSLGQNDETSRRYALSLGISGDVDRAIQILTPQLRAQNRAAWRSRAMILAINGRDKEATEIVNATLPPALAQNILPYLVQMDRLNPAQQAAAAHFGRFPSGDLGPKRKPVQVASATPAPAPAAPTPATSRRRAGSESARAETRAPSAPARAAAKPREVAVAAVPAQPAAATSVVAQKPVPTPAPTAPVAALPAPSAAAPKPIPMLIGTSQIAPAPVAEAPRPAPAAAVPVPVAAQPAAPPPAPPSAAPAAVTIAAATPAPPAAVASSAPEPAPSALPTPVPTPAPAAPIGVTVRESAEPVGPGFSIADIGRQTEAPAAASVAASPPPASVPAAVSAAAPLASLAEIASSIEIPPEELSRPDNAIGADVLLRLQEEKRRADAADAAKREKEAAAAKAKAETEAKAKEEAAQKKAHPPRLWVQIATGANERALGIDYGRFAKKSADLFKGKSGATTEWGRTRRLLVGPFADRKAAQDWLASYKKAGGDGFLFNSEAGQAVDPVK